MSLKTRVEKLEEPLKDSDTPNVILLVGVSPNDKPDREVIGWSVDGIEYFKRPDELYDLFSKRVQAELGSSRPVIAIAIHDDE